MTYDRIMHYAKKHRAIIPRLGSDKHKILAAMFDGYKLTVLVAPRKCGSCALSQRSNELIDDGWPIQKDWMKLRSGKRVKQYWLEA